MGRLLGGLVAAVLLVAAPAQADPVALVDAPWAQDVALAGGEVVVAGGTPAHGIRVEAIPVAGGASRTVLTVSRPGLEGLSVVATSQLVAVLAFFEERDRPEIRLYTGPPAGPLALRRRVRATLRTWFPFALDADADRLLVNEGRLYPRPGFRARVLVPGAAAERVPWKGAVLDPVLAGDRVAFAGTQRRGAQARIDRFFVISRRTGAVEASAKLRPDDELEEGNIDVAPDGRAVAAFDGSLLAIGPGAAPVRTGGGFTAPRFSGDGIAALQEGRFYARAPVVLAPGAPPRAIGHPSAYVEAFEADGAGATWIGNGCVLYAARDGAAPSEPPAGPCPRAELVHEEDDQRLRGRRLRIRLTCVAAPLAGCRGTALLGRRGRIGKRAFALPAGSMRTVAIRLTDRGVRRVRAARRRHDVAIFGLSARVADGRAHGTGSVVVARSA